MKRLALAGIALAALACMGLGVHLLIQAQTASLTAAAPNLNDLAKYQHTDPALIKYREVGSFKPGLQRLSSLATSPAEERIYVTGDQALAIFDLDGQRLSESSIGKTANCITAAPTGELYLGIADHVEVFSRDGAFLAAWQAPDARSIITSIAVAADELYAADAGARTVWRYTRSGKLAGRIGDKDANRGIPGFVIPSPYFDVLPAADGGVWAVNTGRHELEHYARNGALLSKWEKGGVDMPTFCGCCNPSHAALLPDGRFVTAEKGLPRVKIYSAAGTFESVVAGTEAFTVGTVGLDLATDRRCRILVLDPKRGLVRIFVAAPGPG